LACTYCHAEAARDELAFCAGCLAPHHRECFAEHGRCSVQGCAGRGLVQPGAAAPRRAHRRDWFGILLLILLAFVGGAWFGQTRAPADGARESSLQFELTEVAGEAQLRLQELEALEAGLQQAPPAGDEGDGASCPHELQLRFDLGGR